MFGTAVLMAVIVVCSKALGLFRDILIANAYGTTEASQAYEIASKLPIMIFDFIIGGVVTAAFVPIFSSLIMKKNKDEAMKFANSYVNMILIITAAIAVVGIIFSNQLVSFLAPEAEACVLKSASILTKIMFPMVIFTGLAFSFVGILQSMGEFRIPALISLISNLIMVIYLFTINTRFGIIGLAFSMLLGWASQAAVQIPKLHSLGYRYSPKCNLRSPEIKRALISALPILIGTWTQPVCSLINTRYASGMDGGRAISALSYSNKLYIIIVGIFTFVATNLLFPYMSRANAVGDKERSKSMMVTSMKILIFIIAPITIGLMILANPFCALIYQRGAFTAADTALTSEALRCYTVGMIFMSLNEVLTKTFFADNRMVVPMISSLISMTVNIISVIAFSPVLGVGGIALISSLATALNCTINYIVMKKNGRIFSLQDLIDIVKSIISAAIMGIAVYALYRIIPDFGSLTTVILCTGTGIIVYALSAFILRSDEISLFVNKIIKK